MAVAEIEESRGGQEHVGLFPGPPAEALRRPGTEAGQGHGAGRRMSRNQARKQWRGRQVVDELAQQGILIHQARIPRNWNHAGSDSLSIQ